MESVGGKVMAGPGLCLNEALFGHSLGDNIEMIAPVSAVRWPDS